MATRINRKNQTSTTGREVVGAEKPSKTELTGESTVVPNLNNKASGNSTTIGKRIVEKSATKRVGRKPSIGIKLRAKAKTTAKINKKLKRKILQSAKSLENRRKLMRNGLKDSKVSKLRPNIKKEKDDSPPILEPILPIVENIDTKKQLKKRTKKAVDNTQIIDVKKIKLESVDDTPLPSDVTDVCNIDAPNLKKQVKKQRGNKKIKNPHEDIEDTINDLSFFIKKEDIKTEVDSTSESGKSDIIKAKKLTRKQKVEPLEYETYEVMESPQVVKKEDIKLELFTFSETGKIDLLKPKKIAKKQRIELLKKQILKKENIENTLGKIGEVHDKVIDVLDLNVATIKRKPVSKRRHSIEKFSMSTVDGVDITITNLLNHLPRSVSPRSKRNAKVRQSHDGLSRRSSPYSTRSDSPARILRNGKQRKWIDLNLIEGLDTDVKKRRRLCSDLSGSEMSVSKLSGYESDSSFSDLASSHGAENIDVDLAIKSHSFKESFEEGAAEVATTVTEDMSCKKVEIIDTNSNVCNNLNKLELKTENIEVTHESEGSEMEVSEKSVILDIMKQAFNETVGDKSPKATLEAVQPSTFYGKERIDSISPIQICRNHEEDLVTRPFSDPSENTDIETNVALEEDTCLEDEIRPNDSEEVSIGVTSESEKNERYDELNDKDKDIYEKTSPDIVENEDMEEEESIPPALKKIDNVYDFSELERSSPNLDIPHLTNSNLLETERIEQHINLEDDSPSENKESVLEVIDNMEPINQSPRLDESTACEEIVSGIDLSESQNSKEESHSTVCSKEGSIGDSGLTDENGASLADMTDDIDKTTLETPLDITEKESILKALGLQSLRAAEEAKHQPKEKFSNRSDNYTGTLKTVIKLNRDKKKGGRISSFKMTLQNSKSKGTLQEAPATEETTSKEPNEVTSKQDTATFSDTAGAHRKSHYSNRSNMDGSSEHTSDGEGTSQNGTIKALVIPEKASSFSIHPGRLCKDECSYCFGKFGLFDTPCHIAQMKTVERQDKILATEKHLTRDSCLCDACYRHVDRKSNTPSYTNKSLKRNSLVAPGPKENHCHVLGCNRLSTNILRRKWIIKMKKSICQVINIDLDNPGLHSIPICDDHYSALEHLMICSMCKRRLARNHIHYLGPETNELNSALVTEGIPITLTDKPVVCKLCKCFASIILKDAEERSENSINFFNEYRRRLLHFNDILPMDESSAEEPIAVPTRTDKLEHSKKKKKILKNLSGVDSPNSMENTDEDNERLLSSDTNIQSKSRSESPTDEYNVVDYNTLIPAIAMDCGSDNESKKEPKTQPVIIKKILRNEKGQDAVEISKVYRSHSNKIRSDIAVQKLGSNPSISVRQLFPGEEELPLDVQIDFNNVKEQTPEGWEKCTSVIQYDTETKRLWHELQKPYGNQSSFLRHLILLEKYFRNGDLVLSASANHHSINYSESVHNRLRAYDNISTSAKNVQPLSMIPFNKMLEKYNTEAVTCTNVSIDQNSSTNSIQRPIVTASTINRLAVNTTNLAVTSPSSGQRIAKSNTALTITQLNNPILTSGSTVLQQIRPKMVGAPPGLISLNPSSNKQIASLVKVPQSQKIKFPITKNWRPNLIPIDPTKKQERKTGLVQVISGGKPYHITLEDYKKMCAIKRSFEMKQKRLQEVQNAKPILVTHNSVLKSITPKKGLIISKALPPNLPLKAELPVPSSDSNGENENILEKLDKQIEKLVPKFKEKSPLPLPRIPKSLTVIPQSVPKPSGPSSPVLEITPKVSSKS